VAERWVQEKRLSFNRLWMSLSSWWKNGSRLGKMGRHPRFVVTSVPKRSREAMVADPQQQVEAALNSK
jgi:hypothetical protein